MCIFSASLCAFEGIFMCICVCVCVCVWGGGGGGGGGGGFVHFIAVL